MHKFQIHKLVSRCDHLNISTMYSVLTEKNLKYYHTGGHFLESTEISASEDLNALKGTTSDYAVADIKREGSSSDYAVSEIRREMPVSPSVLHA